MSAFQEIQTEYSDKTCLVQALEEMFGQGTVEVHDEPQRLYGYEAAEREESANIIVRRKHLTKASNDMGFVLQEDGTYSMWLSEYDHIEVPRKFNVSYDKFVSRLKHAYGVSKVEANAKKNNWTYTRSVDEDGKTRIRLKLPSNDWSSKASTGGRW